MISRTGAVKDGKETNPNEIYKESEVFESHDYPRTQEPQRIEKHY